MLNVLLLDMRQWTDPSKHMQICGLGEAVAQTMWLLECSTETLGYVSVLRALWELALSVRCDSLGRPGPGCAVVPLL